MVAPNSTKSKVQSKSVRNSFSPKRIGIQRANTVVFAALIGASIIVSASLVTLNFLWDLRGFNNRVIEARTEALDTLDANAENISKLELSFLSLEEDAINSKVVLDALPSKYDFPALATSVDKQITNDQLELTSFDGDDLISEAIDKQIEPMPLSMPFSFTVDGSYDDVVTVIKNFEKTIRPMTIDSLQISGTDSELTASFGVHTYYQPAVDLEVEKKKIQ